jgi:hypothetical protein
MKITATRHRLAQGFNSSKAMGVTKPVLYKITNFMQILFPVVTGHSVSTREINTSNQCLFEIQLEWINVSCVGYYLENYKLKIHRITF